MMLNELLLKERSSILKRWFDLLIATYPADLSKRLAEEKDRFLNPVGAAFSASISTIYDGLAARQPPEEISEAIEKVVKIRAVQDFTPAQAVSFIFLLKRAIREQLGGKLGSDATLREMLDLDTLLDRYACHSFDLYMESRERIFNIRVDEIKNRTFKLLGRAERAAGPAEQASFTKKGQRP